VNFAATAIATNAPEKGIGFLQILTWLGQDKRTIAVVTLLAALVSVATALSLTRQYTAHATMLPPQQQSANGGAAAALSALGALGGLAGGGFGLKTSDELYVSLLRSESVVRALDLRLKLREHYHLPTLTSLIKSLPQSVKITTDKKSGVIDISVDDADPVFAMTLANAHIEELRVMLDRLAVTEAQQRRDFYAQQVNSTKENLIKADQNFQRMQEHSGAIVIDKQAEALLSGMAQIRTRIAEREVQLRVLRQTATAQHPDVQRLQTEIQGLRQALTQMNKNPISAAQASSSPPPGEEASAASSTIANTGYGGTVVDLPAGQIPELANQYVRARREVRFQEVLLESLLKQFELARLDVAKEGAAPQVIDQATLPERPTKPQRSLIVLAGTLLGLIGTSVWVVLKHYTRWCRAQEPQTAQAWATLQKAWRLRGR
jgi:uncharacterized protein involved in exopolysaccharide biosynthesis